MWDWITPENLITMQRKAAWEHMGEQVRILLRDGYPTEADELLDEMVERKQSWNA